MNQPLQAAATGANRIMDIVLLYAQMEAEHRVNNPTMRKDSPEALAMRANQYQNILAGYRRMKGLTGHERNTRSFVRYELRRIKAQLNPTLANRMLNSRPVTTLFNFLKGQHKNRTIHAKVMAGYEKNTTLEVNVAALLQTMKAAGFKDHVEGPLRRLLAHSTQPEINLRYFDVQKPDSDYVLNFKKLPGTDVYYLDNYQVAIRPDLQDILKGKSSTQQMTISMTAGTSLNAEEARKVASGHAIEKKKNGQSVWLVPDPRSLSGVKEVAFDLYSALRAWPIKEVLPGGDAPAILKALGAGRSQEVTFINDNNTEQRLKVHVGLNPQGNGLQLYFRNLEGDLVDARRIQSGQSVQGSVLAMIQSVSLPQNQKLNPLQRLFKWR